MMNEGALRFLKPGSGTEPGTDSAPGAAPA